MPHLPRVTCRAAAALLSVAVASLTALPAGTAAATPAAHTATPTPAARAAGVQPGNATMGWRSQTPTAARGPQLAPSEGSARAKAFVPRGVLGIDVSSWQGRVNWAAQAAGGKRFTYVKATEGLRYRNPYFIAQSTGAASAGLLHGAYHFATPNSSTGRSQARVFVRNGGAWSADGVTLPGVLDIEYNPYGRTCYGLTKTQMVRWVRSFTTEYKRLTTRDAVIYTTTDWWTRCTGNSAAFSTTNPLWLARYATAPGKLPGRWGWATFWQYSSTPVDQNRFSSSYARLRVLALDAG